MKKKSELTFSPIVYAVLALVLIAVCILVFLSLTDTPLKSFFNIGEEVGNESNQAVNGLDDLIKCDPGDEKCVGTKLKICNSEGKWEETENEC